MTAGPPDPAAGRWLARPRKVADPALRLFCVPHVGAGGAAFNSWLAHLPPQVELCAIRFPGRENRLHEPLVEDLPTLLAGLAPAAAPLLDRPFILLGHCSGSVIAFEYARRLRSLGSPEPAMLIVSSAEAPQLRKITDPLHRLPREALLDRVVQFGGMSEAVLDDPDLMAMFERILRADYRVVELAEHAPEPPLSVPITVIGGERDEFVSREAMAAWATETTQACSLRLLDAAHFVLSPAGPVVGQIVGDLLEAE